MNKIIYLVFISSLFIHSCTKELIVDPNFPEWTVYNSSNSSLPGTASHIAIDHSGNKWISTKAGLVKFDGKNWTIYNRSNSGLPSINISFLASDKNNIWIGTQDSGLVKFNGTQWKVYNTSNSGIASNYISCIAVDSLLNIWVGNSDLSHNNNGRAGISKFDGNTWTIYDVIFSGLASDEIFTISIDKKNIKWITAHLPSSHLGETAFLASFDDISWKTFTGSTIGFA